MPNKRKSTKPQHEISGLGPVSHCARLTYLVPYLAFNLSFIFTLNFQSLNFFSYRSHSVNSMLLHDTLEVKDDGEVNVIKWLVW
ncbi:hypothetical protein BVRB_9g219640 [Beta vulgaris subsp. vulgaris]|nr:hypothetical protein BVRB_9g219640 [Beta vulgaris subsp. vulgaris]